MVDRDVSIVWHASPSTFALAQHFGAGMLLLRFAGDVTADEC